MFQPTIWQANNPSNLSVSLDTEELVLESELPDRLQTINTNLTGITETTITKIGNTTSPNIETLQNETKNINTDGNTLNSITSINGIKIGTPHAWNFNYWTYSPYIPVCKAFSGATTI